MYNFYDIDESALAALGGALIIVLLIILAFAIMSLIGLYKVLEKAGQPGWAVFIPFYGSYVIVKAAGLHWMYFLFIISNNIISILDIDDLTMVGYLLSAYGTFMCCYNLAKRFHKETGFAILLFLFSPICYMIMGFSKKYQYDFSVPVSIHGVIDDKKGNTNTEPASDNQANFTSQSDKIQYCSNCGQKVDPEYNIFCPNCGKEISKK